MRCRQGSRRDELVQAYCFRSRSRPNPPEESSIARRIGGEAPLNRTKVGGLPSFIQGDPLEVDNERGLAYLGQLATDIYDCEFGDVGSVYMFIGPNGETDAVMQSH